jgi:hypothetical protein
MVSITRVCGVLMHASRRDLGGILAPLLQLISRHVSWDGVTFLAVGVMLAASALLVRLLPETRGMPQVDTVPGEM